MAPANLGPAGAALWARLVEVFELACHELALLEVACRQADDVAALEALIARDGYVVAGSNGQPRLNMAVTEARQGRLALGKLLAQLALPDEEDRPLSAASRQAKRAAEVRWARVRQQRERQAEAR